LGELREGYDAPRKSSCPLLNNGAGVMRSVVIGFCILAVSIALIVGASAGLAAII